MHLLYLTTNFHSLTLTFVTREVAELRRLGHRVSLLSVHRPAVLGAAQPECDLSECGTLLPVRTGRLAAAVARCCLRRPRRTWRAVAVALTSREDGWRTRAKLLAQLAVAATAVEDVERRGVEHIHAHLASPPGNYALFLSLLTGIPFSFTGHAADLYRRPEAMRAKLARASAAVAISEYNRAHYQRVHGGPLRAPLVHCGIRLADFPYRPRERVQTPLRILAVGRLAEKKGFTHLLDALALLTARNIAWTAQLVGGGPLESALRRQADDLGLRQLTIAGPRQQDEIRAMLDAADVFVLPCVAAADGDIDGIPVALMEAMASGCPVVSTRLSGIPELVIDGVAGLLAEPGDAASLADAIGRLAVEADLVSRLSAGGRRQVEQDFNLATEAAKLAAVFAEIVAGAATTVAGARSGG